MIHTTKRTSFFEMLRKLGAFERLVFGLLLLTVVTSGTYLLYEKNNATYIEIPRRGGTHIEGIVGTPRFINPLLAISPADKDLTSLVYAGLMTRDENGALIPELAESYTISEDGTVYTFVLREGLTFHDGTALTADDVIFTVTTAADPAVRSPLFSNWDGVTIEKVDERTVSFTLPEPYAPFIENMTLGILPAHIWEPLSPEEIPFSQFNITPIGAGPFTVSANDVERDNSGIPSAYNLTSFASYALGEPYINSIRFILYNNTNEAIDGYLRGEVHAINSISPAQLDVLLTTDADTRTAVHRAPLLRIFGIFFNHNKQPVLLEDEVREALRVATPKKAIVGEILRGYGTVLDTPLPSFIFKDAVATTTNTEATETEEGASDDTETGDATQNVALNRIERARMILEDEGWERGEDGIYVYKNSDGEVTARLSITFSTVSNPELVQTAERIIENWQEVGIETELKVFDPSDLTQSVIRPRRFDALLFGMVIGHELDLYAFWHSSQRNDPGLNIAQYADIEADALLEKIRTETDATARTALYAEFAQLISSQNAAIFLYAPDFVYVVNDRLENIKIHPLQEAHERFDTVHLWHVETDTVWPFVRDFVE